MAYMQKQVEFATYVTVETTAGTEIVPTDLVGLNEQCFPAEALADYLEGEPLDPAEPVVPKTGWLARWSAPGYMDCTPWTAFASEQSARDYLDESDEDDES